MLAGAVVFLISQFSAMYPSIRGVAGTYSFSLDCLADYRLGDVMMHTDTDKKAEEEFLEALRAFRQAFLDIPPRHRHRVVRALTIEILSGAGEGIKTRH